MGVLLMHANMFLCYLKSCSVGRVVIVKGLCVILKHTALHAMPASQATKFSILNELNLTFLGNKRCCSKDLVGLWAPFVVHCSVIDTYFHWGRVQNLTGENSA